MSITHFSETSTSTAPIRAEWSRGVQISGKVVDPQMCNKMVAQAILYVRLQLLKRISAFSGLFSSFAMTM